MRRLLNAVDHFRIIINQKNKPDVSCVFQMSDFSRNPTIILASPDATVLLRTATESSRVCAIKVAAK